MSNAAKNYRKVVKFLSSPAIFYYDCMWLIVLLCVGTYAQVDMGIHASQEMYFSSWITYFDPLPIPLPGGRLTIGIMFVNLFSKLMLNSPFSVKRVGIIIAHLGTFLLLVGGLITAYGDIEGSMMIPEGKQSAFFQDHHKLEVTFTDTSSADYDEVTAFSGANIVPGARLQYEDFAGTFEVEEFYLNCTIKRRQQDADNSYKGVAKRFEFTELKPEKEATMNASGIMLKVSGLGAEADGRYLIFENIAIPATLTMNGKNYIVELRQKHYQLPFSIQLLDFEKQVHTGTEKARAFKSVVNVIEGGALQRVVIEMNKPMRRGGYTFYQSSFIQAEGETTILSVVKNAGRLFPYISSIIICIGLGLHLLISFVFYKRSLSNKEDQKAEA